ncbi:MAG: ABC transporter permease [Desulfobacterales bacterium PC51MH44]|nr:amino acid ABC transporter permease [Desulfobacterales bacterium]OEU63503.1 MAG: ABC transporter permease [Desulfobacterales bacterium PC51MH44]
MFDLAQTIYFSKVLMIGAVMTVKITFGALIIAIIVGFIMAAIRTYSKIRLLEIMVNIYVEIFRGIPPLAQLFIIYFGLAYAGVKLEPATAAVLGLGLIGGAMLTEVFRSGLNALHFGQREAALAIGMTPMMALRYIIFPQATRITLPPLGSYAIGLLKDTSIVSAIAAPEIMFYARNLVTSTFQTTLIYILAALLYFILSFPLARVVDRLERKQRAWT